MCPRGLLWRRRVQATGRTASNRPIASSITHNSLFVCSMTTMAPRERASLRRTLPDWGDR
eukprot:scaffold43952_cov270-Isochrysis_galbana.AAC.2